MQPLHCSVARWRVRRRCGAVCYIAVLVRHQARQGRLRARPRRPIRPEILGCQPAHLASCPSWLSRPTAAINRAADFVRSGGRTAIKPVRFRLFLRAASHTPLPVRAVAWRSRAKGFGWIVRSLCCRLALRQTGALQAPLKVLMMMSRRAAFARQGALWLSTRASGRTAIARRAAVLHSASRLECGIRLLPDLVPHSCRLALPCLTRLPATPGQACRAWWLTARQARMHAPNGSQECVVWFVVVAVRWHGCVIVVGLLASISGSFDTLFRAGEPSSYAASGPTSRASMLL